MDLDLRFAVESFCHWYVLTSRVFNYIGRLGVEIRGNRSELDRRFILVNVSSLFACVALEIRSKGSCNSGS